MAKKLQWKTETRKVSELVPHEKNPRRMTKDQVEKLTASLEKFNLVELPAINSDNTILAGHQRLKILAMTGRGEEEIEVRVPNRALTESEAEEYLLRSNRNRGEWDYDMLANHFDFDFLDDVGFSDGELGIFDGFDLEPEPEEEGDDLEPTDADGSKTKNYKLFEVLMKTSNRDVLVKVLSDVKELLHYETTEQALMYLVEKYIDNHKK